MKRLVPTPLRCPGCQAMMAPDVAVCDACGARIGPSCEGCGTVNRPHSRFCRACGHSLSVTGTTVAHHPALPQVPPATTPSPTRSIEHGERKRVTVLSSDLSDYSRLCQQMDPEAVREMMDLVFRSIAEIILEYGGHIDRIIGDGVLAVFGVPHVHEDDPQRAVHAALDIHAAVAEMGARFGDRLDHPLAMHSGIATGLVVTGKIELTAGRHGITGDTVNRALLLTHLASTGEILAGECTMTATRAQFLFDACRFPLGGGQDDWIDAFRVLTMACMPDRIHRHRGLRASLIGREIHMETLQQAFAAVSQGQGGCVFISGGAGTGKSRLIAEFRNRLSHDDVCWLEGNAHHYTQNIPYYPLINLLAQALSVCEKDSETEIREKLIRELSFLESDAGEIAQVLEPLFTLADGRSTGVTPETWKRKLQQALVQLCTHQARRSLMIICLEDLHWFDPSTLAVFRSLLNEANLNVLFVVSYRSGQLPFSPRQFQNPHHYNVTLHLGDLRPEMADAMLRSLLGTNRVPTDLSVFVIDQLNGNPFFIEEMVNALVDDGTLKKKAGEWQLQGPIASDAVVSTIGAVIAARLDRLGGERKRIVQAAAVIGKRFSTTLLRNISDHPEKVPQTLAMINALGLILKSVDADEPAFRFKHALVQDVAYRSLLRRERKDLHERIARTLEQENPDRIDALVETLAHHYRNGYTVDKAVAYLCLSARKGLKKYAVVEAHQYYQDAYRILTEQGEPLSQADIARWLSLLIEWFFVFHLRGRYRDALARLTPHESLARASTDLHLKGLFLACLGCAYQKREQLTISRDYLLEAIEIGEKRGDHRLVAYASAHLIWTCTDMGRLDEALQVAEKAKAAADRLQGRETFWSDEMDQDLLRSLYTGTAVTHMFRGDSRQCRRLGDRLLRQTQQAHDANSRSGAYLAYGMGAFVAGDFEAAIDHCRVATDSSADSFYRCNAEFIMAWSYLAMADFSPAEHHFENVVAFCRSSGYDLVGKTAEALSTAIRVARGEIRSGVVAFARYTVQYRAIGKQYHTQMAHYLLGGVYLSMVLGVPRLRPSLILRNLWFLLGHWPRAARLAERHLKTAIGIAGQIGALGIKGQACLDLGRLYLAKKRRDLAMPLLMESIALFEAIDAREHLRRARSVANLPLEGKPFHFKVV